MKLNFFFMLCLFLFSSLYAQEETSNVNTEQTETKMLNLKVVLVLPSSDDKSYYEIEYSASKTSSESPLAIIKEISQTLFKDRVSEKYLFLRVRKITEEGETWQKGNWGEYMPVNWFIDKEQKSPMPMLDDTNKSLTVIKNSRGQKKQYLKKNRFIYNVKKNVNVYYRLNSLPYIKYKNEVLLDVEGRYQLAFYSEEASGGYRFLDRFQFEIDSRPPKTEMKFIGNTNFKDGLNILGPNSQIRLHSRDDNSGVKTIYYRISKADESEKDFAIYNNTIALDLNQLEGYYIIEYYSVDKVGNEEAIKSLAFGVDNVAPRVHEVMNASELIIAKGKKMATLRFKDFSPVEVVIINNGKRSLHKSYAGTISYVFNEGDSVQFEITDLVNNKTTLKLK